LQVNGYSASRKMLLLKWF